MLLFSCNCGADNKPWSRDPDRPKITAPSSISMPGGTTRPTADFGIICCKRSHWHWYSPGILQGSKREELPLCHCRWVEVKYVWFSRQPATSKRSFKVLTVVAR